MSYVAASMLMHTGEEFLAFKCFSNIMNKPLIHNFYSFDMPRINIFFHIFMRLLKEKNPKLSQIFDEFQIQPSVFLFEWVVALFSNVLQLELSARIWDNYFLYGDWFLMKTCLAICQCLSEKLVTGNFDMIIIMFKQVKQHVTSDEVFKALDASKLTEQQFDEVRIKVENEPTLVRYI